MIDHGSQPNSTAAASAPTTTTVAPMCPTTNATISRMLRRCSSASASRHAKNGIQKYSGPASTTKALPSSVPTCPCARLCRLVLAC
ncbi:Uncharacterised protein [Mycobacterium tuberculosis]|nr:Uncharacterised protein [Mycobacterium tuberculosis]